MCFALPDPVQCGPVVWFTVLSKENWPYKRANLTSGLKPSVADFDWDLTKIDLLSEMDLCPHVRGPYKRASTVGGFLGHHSARWKERTIFMTKKKSQIVDQDAKWNAAYNAVLDAIRLLKLYGSPSSYDMARRLLCKDFDPWATGLTPIFKSEWNVKVNGFFLESCCTIIIHNGP